MTADPLPYYDLHVFICTNTRQPGHARGSCAVSGATPLRDYLKARVKELGLSGVRINSAGCLDRCELGPVLVIYPQGIWYRFISHADIEEILQTHLVEGKRATRLMLHPEEGPSSPHAHHLSELQKVQ